PEWTAGPGGRPEWTAGPGGRLRWTGGGALMESSGLPGVPPYPKAHQLLEGRTVLVTAAAGTGIGLATARRCAEEGAFVVVSDRHERRLNEAAEELEPIMGTRPPAVPCDV